MNTSILRAFMALCLMLIMSEATAIPSFVRIGKTFAQAPGVNGQVYAGLFIEAHTGLQYLAVGGGFTLTCNTSPLAQGVGPRAQPSYNPFGVTITLNVPEAAPGAYTVPNWSAIPAGECDGQCVMQWSAQARDESTEFSVGTSGVGASFHLLPQGEIADGGPLLIDICRSGQPQCCTPGCSIN